MKKLFSINKATTTIDLAILVTRISIAVMMLVHGVPKMGMLLSGNTTMFPSVFGLSSTLSLTLAVFAEVICSAFLLIGLGTRLAAVPLLTTMLVAVFVIHANDPFTNKELAIHYLFTYFVLFLTGSGRYSVDALLQSKERSARYTPVKAENSSSPVYQ